jgi:hypothetical protein
MKKSDWFLFFNLTIFTLLEGKLEELDLPCRCVQLCYKECIYGGILAKITIFMFFFLMGTFALHQH